ncbi:MAG: hypothetical protein AABX08_02955 [Nanoarchaeota archaeon]
MSKIAALLKILIILSIIALFIFLFLKNLNPTGAVILDIKRNNSLFTELTPTNRITQVNNITELSGGLVYFNSIVPERANEAIVRAWFKDNFPEASTFSIGARDKKEWSYQYIKVFEKTYNKPIFTKETLPDEFEFGSKVYNKANIPLKRELVLEIENQGRSIIKNALRGQHQIYAYLTQPLGLEVEKKDINWYENEDRLKIKLLKETDLLDSKFIEDDGITNTDKSLQKLQETKFNAEILEPGLYIIELENNGDMIIQTILINTKKFVFPKIFLADNRIYSTRDKNISLYSYLIDGKLNLITYHKEGLQKIKIDNQEFNFNTEDETLTLQLEKGIHKIELAHGDIIISGSQGSYFTFDEENYFHPYKFYLTNDPKDADYIILDKIPKNNVQEEDGWLKAEAIFDLNELYINENRELSFVFNTPHLSKNETISYTIPIKRIEVEYFQEPLI